MERRQAVDEEYIMSPFPSLELKVEARLCLTKKKIWRANNEGGDSSEETFTARPLSCARRCQAADWKPSQSCAQTRRRRCWACALPGKHRLICTFILTRDASHSQPGPSACKAGLCQCQHILQIFIELSAKTAFTTGLEMTASCGNELLCAEFWFGHITETLPQKLSRLLIL